MDVLKEIKMMHALLHVKIVGITISFYDDLLDISFNTNEQMAR